MELAGNFRERRAAVWHHRSAHHSNSSAAHSSSSGSTNSSHEQQHADNTAARLGSLESSVQLAREERSSVQGWLVRRWSSWLTGSAGHGPRWKEEAGKAAGVDPPRAKMETS